MTLSSSSGRTPTQHRSSLSNPNVAILTDSLDRAKRWLLSQQHTEGYWCGELEADIMLEADYIFLHKLLGTRNPERLQRALNEILRHQNEDGGWSLYPGGPSNVNYGVKAYLALKLMGWSKDHPVLVKARKNVLALGGVTECNTFTKIYLCGLGQYDFDAVPAIPPEILLFPRWCYFNIYEISAWSRGILVPLSIIYAKKPFRKIPPGQDIDELFVGGRKDANLRLRWDKKSPLSWRNFFIALDRLAHLAERVHIRPLRRLALRRAELWMLERFEKSDGLGAIYPAILNSIIALRCLGYPMDHPQVVRAVEELERLGTDYPDGSPDCPTPTFRMQPCFSPVWDTAQAVCALRAAGVPKTDPQLRTATEWLLSKEVRTKGDWSNNVRNVAASGWYFEFNNEFYPDVDDTGQVLMALDSVRSGGQQNALTLRALDWIWAMQCKNGGWAAFDKDNTKSIFQYIPFADHNAMLDPPSVDITGRTLEMLVQYGYSRTDRRVEKAVQFILREQEPDGCWYGRWGVNYLYGTFLALRGLRAVGLSAQEPCMARASQWIRSVQNLDGGWGETCGTYDHKHERGTGPSTASQTAWALLGLLAGGDRGSRHLALGFRWLVERQHPDGSWDELARGRNGENYYTGTGFPCVFYLGYQFYKQYFPLLALAEYLNADETSSNSVPTEEETTF